MLASEVKHLATQTARSIEEIAQHINQERTATSASDRDRNGVLRGYQPRH